MLQFSRAQLLPLLNRRESAFIDRAIAFVRAELPDVSSRGSESLLIEFVQFGWAKARQYGFESEQAIMAYVLLMIGLGVHFDEDPKFAACRSLLTDTASASPATRMQFLLSMAAIWLQDTDEN